MRNSPKQTLIVRCTSVSSGRSARGSPSSSSSPSFSSSSSQSESPEFGCKFSGRARRAVLLYEFNGHNNKRGRPEDPPLGRIHRVCPCRAIVIAYTSCIVLRHNLPWRYSSFAILFADRSWQMNKQLEGPEIVPSSASCASISSYLITYNRRCTSTLDRSLGERVRWMDY